MDNNENNNVENYNEQPEVQESFSSFKEEKPKNNKKIIIIIIALLVVVSAVLFVVFGTDLLKEKKNDEPAPVAEDVASKFAGIYQNNDSLLLVKNETEVLFRYTLTGAGLFQGKAKVNGNKAKETQNGEFTFEYKDGNIDVGYDSVDAEPIIDLGLYSKVADYNNENIYKYVVGDEQYLDSSYNGLYKNKDITIALFQISEDKVKAELYQNDDFDFPPLSAVFTINSESNLVSKSIFEEEETAYEITFTDQSFSLTVNTDIFGMDENDERLEGTYFYSGKITRDEILKEFYTYY